MVPKIHGRVGVIQRNPVPTGNAYGVSSGPNDVSLIHRVDPDFSAVGTVRVYLTVFAFSSAGYKDVHADGVHIKLIAKTADTMFNIGDPRRAFHYYNTYRAQTPAATCPIIRCFEIPKWLYDKATGNAISEVQRSKLGRNNAYNVDKERGQNQFGVHETLRDEIEREGRNLVSYVEPDQVASVATNSKNGTVKDVNELRRRLGMPTEGLDFMSPLRGAHVVSPRQEAAHGADLTRLYDDLDALVTIRNTPTAEPRKRVAAERKIAESCTKGSPNYYGDHIGSRVLAQNIPTKSLEALRAFRDEIGRAATFSVIPQMVTEEYLQANARLHAEDQLKATLRRLGADLDELIAIRSDARLASNRAGVELRIANKCAWGTVQSYGRYLGTFVRGKRISYISVPELEAFRAAVSRAESGSGASLSLDETYMRNTQGFLPDVRDKNDAPLSRWASAQQYRVLTPPPYVPPPKVPKTKPSDEEIARLREQKGRSKK